MFIFEQLIKPYSMETLNEILTATYSGLTLYYRDTNLPGSLIEKYKVGQVLREESFIAMSARAGGLIKSLRFAIATNKAKDQSLITPNAARWFAFRLEPGAYFKVLDIYKIDDQVQIFLLHFDETHLEAFQKVKSKNEARLVEKVRKKFEEKVDAAFLDVLSEEKWLIMTEFPIGMRDSGDFIRIRRMNTEFRNRLLGIES